MSEMNRRDLLVAMSTLAALGSPLQAQNPVATSGGSLGKARVFSPEGNLKKMPNGSERWGILDGTFATGEAVSMHESVVPAGTPASPAHKIQHSELILVQEGTLNFEHDGLTDSAPAGSVIYVAYGTNHAVSNPGPGPARYFVLQMGGDTKKS